MSYITNTSRASEWLKEGQNFVQVATDNASALGLTTSQITGLTNTFTAFENAYAAQETQYAAYRASVELKDETMASFETLVRRYAKQFRGNPSISNVLLEQLNVAPHSVPATMTSPKQVLNLVAETNSVGQVFLKFKRNGNIQGTTFWIQKQTAIGEWTTVETTTRAKVTLNGYEPGVSAWFRVIATRRGLKSAPSTSVNIYGGEESAELKIAA